jgi:hypothetical protein
MPPSCSASGFRTGLLLVAGGVLLAATGCRTAEAVVAVPGKTLQAVTSSGKEPLPAPPDPMAVQQNVQRFAEEFSAQMNLGIDKLTRHGTPMPPAEVLRWKIAVGTDICGIASGANAVANLLDLTVLVSVTRAAAEQSALASEFGASIQPLLAYARSAEAEAWRLAATVLTDKQQAELREAIAAWQRQNPQPENILATRAVTFTTQLAPMQADSREKPGSVFGLLRLDPLAGLDPATREIAQSRLLAERALYVTQKMPQLLRWQMELLSLNALATPTVQQLVTNTTQLTAAVERVSLATEQFPAQLDRQREEIFKALDTQEQQLTPLVAEVRQALGNGKSMSDSLNITIGTMDALMKRFGVGEPKPAEPADAKGEPFRIQDYTQSAAQFEATARQLTELLRGVDQALASPQLSQLSAGIAPAVQEAKVSGKEIVDYAFSRALLLVAAVVVAALLYRFLTRRISSAPRPPPPSP